MPYGGAKGGRPLVLPHEHGGRAPGFDRGSERRYIVLAQEHRQLSLVRAQPTELAVLEVREFVGLEGTVGILLQNKQVEHPDELALDEVGQGGRDLPVESTAGELDHEPVNRTKLVDTGLISHLALLS